MKNLTNRSISSRGLSLGVFFLCLLILGCHKQQPVSDSLPRATPEEEGVSSKAILGFVGAISSSRHEFHSFMLIRHGKVIAEGWWKPYAPGLRHTLYSTSKSFTATAAGFAVTEGKLSLADKVVSFFPGLLPDSVSPFLADMTVKDLLTMSAGQEPDPTFRVVSADTNWVRAFLHTPVLHDPGSVFLYNSLATYMVSAIVQQVTGESVESYLKPRLFEPLGISGQDWELDPQGRSVGGWGLRIKTEDLAKFGLLFLQKGKWNGAQVLPESWISEATAASILQSPSVPQTVRDSSDWLQGYGYQMWRCRHNAYRGDGAYGQFIIVMPEQDAVLAITCETPDMQDEINLVWEHLLPAMQEGKLPADPESAARLKSVLAELNLPLVSGERSSLLVPDISGKTFVAEPNEAGIESVSFQFSDSICQYTLKAGGQSYSIAFGSGIWLAGETEKPGPGLTAGAKTSLNILIPAKIRTSFAWKEPAQLELRLRYIESPHTEKCVFRFEGNKLQAQVYHSQSFGNPAYEFAARASE